MTEDEWNTSTDPQPMLEFLRGKASDRKLRLFAVACCRRIWRLLDPVSRNAVELAEAFADGLATLEDTQRAAWEADRQEFEDDPGVAAAFNTARCEGDDSGSAAYFAAQAAGVKGRVSDEEQARQAELLRDIFGSVPFRPIAMDPAWNTSAVVRLAKAIYEGRAFDRLPILADVLEDAGCTDPDILVHCRGPGPHARGCWVVDLLLMKEKAA